jgi:hypothetical protein
VVAAEVRALAQRSAEAAKEVKALIGESVAGVGEGARQVEEAAKTIERAVASVRTVSGVIEEIAAASTEQTTGLEEINRAIVQLERVTQQNAALVEQAAAAALSFEKEAKSLSDAVSAFKIDYAQQRMRTIALIEKAAAHLQKVGPRRAFDDFDDKNGAFVEGDYYIAAFDLEGVRTAVGLAPNARGDRARPLWWRDLAPIVRKGKGWFDYPHITPGTRKIQWKSSYIERVGEHILLCGFYRDQYEIERVVEAQRSQELLQELPDGAPKRPALVHR